METEREISADEIAELEDSRPDAAAIENADQAPDEAAGDPGSDSPDAPGRKGNDPSVRQAGL